MTLTDIITLIVAALITQNIVFSQTLGICPFLGVSKKTNSGVGMGLAVTFVLVMSSLVCWILNTYVLVPLELEYLQVIVFILVIASLVQLLDIVLKKFAPALYNSLGIYLALITTNCAVLGTAKTIVGYTIGKTLLYSLFTGLGFMFALVIMSGVRERMETANIPKFFKGFAITLIAAAIMAMAFKGFDGFSIARG